MLPKGIVHAEISLDGKIEGLSGEGIGLCCEHVNEHFVWLRCSIAA